jgi:hypothetical protein
MGRTVWGSNARGAKIFRTYPDRPWGPPGLLYIGYRVFLGVKSNWGMTLPPSPPSSAVGQERVELYLYSPNGPCGLYRASVSVQGWPLPFTLPYNIYCYVAIQLTDGRTCGRFYPSVVFHVVEANPTFGVQHNLNSENAVASLTSILVLLEVTNSHVLPCITYIYICCHHFSISRERIVDVNRENIRFSQLTVIFPICSKPPNSKWTSICIFCLQEWTWR